MATVAAPARQSLLLHGIDWRTYTRLLYVFADRPSIRMAYDRGELEISSPPPNYLSNSYLLGQFVNELTEIMELPLKSCRTIPLRSRRKQRGIEADNCYWITHEAQMRGKRRLDLRVDPPPDLAIEVDMTPCSMNRLAIYATLRVPELWRLEGQQLTFHVLGADRRYTVSATSQTFPFVTPADLLPYLALSDQIGCHAVVRQFRAWVRQQLAGGTLQPPNP